MLENLLRQGFEALCLPLDALALERYRCFFEYLEEVNKVMNLTAISGQEDVARLHFLDCAALLKLADFSGKSLIDVGTGAGFPGLALKIACPDLKLTLLDSLDKRVKFLRELCRKLGFEETACIHARAEEAPAALRQGFDFAASRAVARLNLLSELCLPFVRPGGVFIAMKGPGAAEELAEARRGIGLLGGGPGRIEDYRIPGTEIVHSAVLIPKSGPTPEKYPRRWAQIKKQPL